MAILLTMEIIVKVQDKGISEGAVIKALNIAKLCLYSLLWLAMGYWIFRGHYMFAWDELVWITGFVAIEMNVVAWRKELKEEQAELA